MTKLVSLNLFSALRDRRFHVTLLAHPCDNCAAIAILVRRPPQPSDPACSRALLAGIDVLQHLEAKLVRCRTVPLGYSRPLERSLTARPRDSANPSSNRAPCLEHL